jgi:hypothetical protein
MYASFVTLTAVDVWEGLPSVCENRKGSTSVENRFVDVPPGVGEHCRSRAFPIALKAGLPLLPQEE